MFGNVFSVRTAIFGEYGRSNGQPSRDENVPMYRRPIATYCRLGLLPLVQRRWNSAFKEYLYQDIKKLAQIKPGDKVVVDVREPHELQSGKIPNAVNIPYKSSPEALSLSAADFEDKFGFPKPDLSKEVIFYCRSGVRSTATAEIAKANGYTNIGNYRGSWLDWAKHEGIKAE